MLLTTIKRFLTEEEGQGTTEYILIVALIAIALIGTFVAFRDKIFDFIKQLGTDVDDASTQSQGKKAQGF